jgi:uncharacterized protein YrrD
MTHYDGNDVLVLNDRGDRLHQVDEVQVEPDRAVVLLKHQDDSWFDPQRFLAACTIHSLCDGKLRWRGPVRLVCT